MGSPGVNHLLTSQTSLDYYAPERALFLQEDWPSACRRVRLIHTLSGFRIPTLAVARKETESPKKQLARLLRRFTLFIRAMHNPNQRNALALHIVAHPERSALGAEIGIYFLCRAASENYTKSVSKADRLVKQIKASFPQESFFNYGFPRQLDQEDIKHIAFHKLPDEDIQIVELRKFEDCLTTETPQSRFIPAEQSIDYIPHAFWSDINLDPWLVLIEMLFNQDTLTAISVVLEPTRLVELEGVAILAQQFHKVAQAGSRRDEWLEKASQLPTQPERRSWLQKMLLAKAYQTQGLNDYLVLRAKRGDYVYNQLLGWQDHLFSMRITLAAYGKKPEILDPLANAIRPTLSSPDPESDSSKLGWMRPEAVRPITEQEKLSALKNLRWLGQLDWGKSQANPKLRRLRYLTTAEEAAGLFHLPIMPQAGQTTAISTSTVPFVVPLDVASVSRFKNHEESSRRKAEYDSNQELVQDRSENIEQNVVSLGYVYQRERLLSPKNVGGEESLEFRLEISDLKKPSLLVGAPGSGKSNLALYLLIQLWRDHKIPFLVLDPSTGHEYRYLFSEPSLQDDLIVYTMGDEEGLPFRFNPFDIPPDATVRGHITRLLSCFKAAYEMWDPLPAIYEAALAHAYTKTPFNWKLDDKGKVRQSENNECKSIPCLADFNQAIIEHLEKEILPDYGTQSEAAGILTGASKIRVQGILNSLGYVLNVKDMRKDFFQNLLGHPVVIELGSLGDPSNIALAMAFLITQLVGHIEHAYRQNPERRHLLLIEEAHRLLSAETSATSGPNQGNAQGKSAEEMNTILAEVRKYGQGIMVLDQRPSSLVGGVLDNAQVNIMCRLNDRIGFEHLGHVLNLDDKQKKYARTRLRPGDALVLDSHSGKPVLTRSPNVVDNLRNSKLSLEAEKNQMLQNAAKTGLTPPQCQPISREQSSKGKKVFFDDKNRFVELMKRIMEQNDWIALDRQLRVWIKNNSQQVKRLLLYYIFNALDYSEDQQTEILAQLERNDLLMPIRKERDVED